MLTIILINILINAYIPCKTFVTVNDKNNVNPITSIAEFASGINLINELIEKSNKNNINKVLIAKNNLPSFVPLFGKNPDLCNFIICFYINMH